MRLEDHILLETPDFVIVNKPSGVLTLPDRHDNELISLNAIMKKAYGEIFVVHRLDRDTSGIILFARNEAAHKYFSQLFEGRDVKKYYLGLVSGQPAVKQGSVNEGIMEHPVQKGKMVTNRKGKASLTDYEVLEEFGLYSLVRMRIHTGRTHQIRVHMKFLGHPIAVDELYGSPEPVLLSAIKKKFKLGKHTEEERPILSRLALHAAMLEFKGPNGQPYVVEAPLPKDMSALLNQLRKHRS
ncbi:RluA family pseudouridine synthase [Chitinophaga nivalis]|uniref:Pseudouridine synthase n=1 Tax=Chitinophaga nivalis TaxID=2991709 RepID=A0ABT3IWN1_9BACT|nr:RluA family pseudouridine synthase [Chitinophaga nivalis]MCW3461946.1 RluA family pseudouridine synthase [Chitinophaga nivalis]MCW3488363.1 RluA family pseudouridine synthase [Chitinophaga nivalis]